MQGASGGARNSSHAAAMTTPSLAPLAERPGSWSVLGVPAYRQYAISRIFSTIANAMLQAIVAWQVYAISGSAVQLGLIGLARFLPSLAISLVGGVVVDTYDRRKVLLGVQVLQLLSGASICAATVLGVASLPALYALVFAAGVASSFEGPARQALIPGLVPRHLFARALTVNSTLQSLSSITGPAVGGLLIAASGPALAYGAYSGCVVLAMLFLLLIHFTGSTAPGAPAGSRVEALREGIRYLRERPVLLGTMSLDMFAVIFGGAKALLPIYAVNILQVGATGYGILSASMDGGALLMSLVLVSLPVPPRSGRALLLTVSAFGLATVGFGLSTWLPLSILSYAAVGMADQISVVARQNMIQLSTPDHLRGRVTAVSSLFVSASNQVGSIESGFVAALVSPVFAVVSGGLGCMAVVGIIAWLIPELRSYTPPDHDDQRSPA
jgi:MFS family permease